MYQVESFGVHIAHEGSLLVGAGVDAILDRLQDNISLDYLSRFIVDAVQANVLEHVQACAAQ